MVSPAPRAAALLAALALAALLVLLAALPAPARAAGPEQAQAFAGLTELPPGIRAKKGIFKVKLSGVQTTRWTHHSKASRCSPESEGGGVEKARFSTPMKRMKLTAFGNKRAASMIFPPMKVRGKVNRQGVVNHTPLPYDPSCPYGDGDGEMPPPDCGTRAIRGMPVSMLALDGYFRLRSEAGITEHRPYYANCPLIGHKWPQILTERSNGKPIQTRFDTKLFFNPKFKRSKPKKWSKVIVIGQGTARQRSFTTASTVKLEWRMVAKRLR